MTDTVPVSDGQDYQYIRHLIQDRMSKFLDMVLAEGHDYFEWRESWMAAYPIDEIEFRYSIIDQLGGSVDWGGINDE